MAKLKLAEVREMSKLCKKHWGDGKIRSLLRGEGGYRPTLIVSVSERQRRVYSLDELKDFRKQCAERARLADLYDRAQQARGDSRRAARS